MKKTIRDLKIPNILFWGILRRPKSNADRIHRSFVIYFWKNSKGIKVRIKGLMLFLLSPLAITRRINKQVSELGKKARALAGKSILRQWLEQFYLAYFYSITPKTYYLQEFYLADGLARARNYVNRDAMKQGVYVLIKEYLSSQPSNPKTPPLSDKLSVSQFLLQNELMAIPVLLVVNENGSFLDNQNNPTDKLPQADMFCKPRNSKGGKDAEVWYWLSDDSYKNPLGEVLSSQELKQRFINYAHKHSSYIIQPLVLPHPDLQDFRIHATPSLRIISYLKGTEVKIDSVRFKFSLDNNSVVDNTHAGGVSVPIDLDTGEMTTAVESRLTGMNARWDRHELLNGPIKGRKLPYMDETIDLVKRAHTLFPSDIIIGWDVVISKEGPIIIEGNNQPDSTFPQRAYLMPYGCKEIGQVIADYAEKAITEMYQ